MSTRAAAARDLVRAWHEAIDSDDDGETLIAAENALADWLAVRPRGEGAQRASALIRAAADADREHRT